MYKRDSTTLHTWNPEHTGYNKFREVEKDIWSAWDNMNWEQQAKYVNQYEARSKANTELRSAAKIFRQCHPTLSEDDTTLDATANCIRGYFKRINARDDMHFLYT